MTTLYPIPKASTVVEMVYRPLCSDCTDCVHHYVREGKRKSRQFTNLKESSAKHSNKRTETIFQITHL